MWLNSLKNNQFFTVQNVIVLCAVLFLANKWLFCWLYLLYLIICDFITFILNIHKLIVFFYWESSIYCLFNIKSTFEMFDVDFFSENIYKCYFIYTPVCLIMFYLIVAPIYLQIPVSLNLKKLDISKINFIYKKSLIVNSFIWLLSLYLLVVFLLVGFYPLASIIFKSKLLIYKSLAIDIYSVFFINIILLFFIFFLKAVRTLLLSAKYSNEYFFILLFSIFFLLMCLLTYDIFFLLIGLEGVALSLYLLILCTNGSSQGSVESGLKYFFLGSISSSMASIGISFIYNNLGTLNIYKITDYCFYSFNFYTHFNSSLLTIIGILLITFNFLFKLSVPPMHSWTPEVFTGSSILPIFFMSSVIKLGNFFIFIKWIFLVYWVFPSNVIYYINPLLIILSVSGLFIGAFGAINQTKLKKFLAYTSINQLSSCLLSLTVCTVYGFVSAVTHILIYVITLCIFFTSILKMSKNKNTPVYLTDISKYIYIDPVYCLLAIFSIFSFSGIPPSSLFFTKLFIMKTLLISNKIVILLLFLLSNVYSTFYYVKLIKIFITRGVSTNSDLALTLHVEKSSFVDNSSFVKKPSISGMYSDILEYELSLRRQQQNTLIFYYSYSKIYLYVSLFIKKVVTPLVSILILFYIIPSVVFLSPTYTYTLLGIWFLLTFHFNLLENYNFLDDSFVFNYHKVVFNFFNIF